MPRLNLPTLCLKLALNNGVLNNGVFFLGLGLSLFLPAGTFGYWQAWVFLGLYAGSILAISLYFLAADPEFLERRILGREPDTGQKRISAAFGVLTLAALVAAGLNRRFRWSVLPFGWTAFGDLLFLAGFCVVFWVFRENRDASNIVAVREGQRTIRTGPYALVRHPMYFGTWLMLLGAPLALGCWVALCVVLPLTLLLGMRAVNEERLLAAKLSGYPAYLASVRWRLLPLIW